MAKDMTSDAEGALHRAIKYLGASEVAPGRYTWRGPEFECYVVADVTTILSFDYSGWVAGIDYSDPVICMPEWWSPENRYARRCWTLDEVSGANEIGKLLAKRDIGTFKDVDYECDVAPLIKRGAHCEKITVNYETGEEIAA